MLQHSCACHFSLQDTPNFHQILSLQKAIIVFNTEELKGEIALHADDVVVDQGEIVCDWRTNLTKYSKLPGIRSLHDFVFAKNVTGGIVCKIRRLCYTGSFPYTYWQAMM